MDIKKAKVLKRLVILSLLATYVFSFDLLQTNISEFQISTTGWNNLAPCAAVLTSGDYVVTWKTMASSVISDIVFAVIKSDGTRLSGPTSVLSTTTNNPSGFVASDKLGGFIIIWDARDTSSTTNDTYVRYYDASYTAGNAVKLNSTSSVNSDYTYPTLALLGNNNYLGIWNQGPTSNGLGFGQQVTISLPTTPFLTNQNISANNLTYGPRGISLGNGTFATCFHSVYSLGEWNICCTIFNENDYLTIKPIWIVNTKTSNVQANAAVELLSNGNWVVTYTDLNNGYEVWFQIYTKTGVAVGINVKANTVASAAGAQAQSLGADGFVITYNANNGGNKMYYQLFNLNGSKIRS
jgi:hypothetical protein